MDEIFEECPKEKKTKKKKKNYLHLTYYKLIVI
jgi:hypothetical protein